MPRSSPVPSGAEAIIRGMNINFNLSRQVIQSFELSGSRFRVIVLGLIASFVLVTSGLVLSNQFTRPLGQTLPRSVVIIEEVGLLIPPETNYVRNVIINSGADVKVVARTSDQLSFGIFLIDNKTGTTLKRISPLSQSYFPPTGGFDFKTEAAGIYRFAIRNGLQTTATLSEFRVIAKGYVAESAPLVAKGRTPNLPLTVTDGINDLALDRGNVRPSGVNLAPVDIRELEVSNDGKNLIVKIKTSGVIPKAYRDRNSDGYYFFNLMVHADENPNKLVDWLITSQETDWLLWPNSGVDARDNLLVAFQIDGKTVTFTISLSLRKFNGDLNRVGVRVVSGYEAGPNTLYDYIPDQNRLDFKFVDYRLWL